MTNHFWRSSDRGSQNRRSARQAFENSEREWLLARIDHQHIEALHELRNIVPGSQKPNAIGKTSRFHRARQTLGIFFIAIKEGFADHYQDGIRHFLGNVRECFNQFELAFARRELTDNTNDRLATSK